MIQRRLALFVGLLLFTTIPALATPLISVGFSTWSTGITGTVRDTASNLNTNVNLENDLHIGRHLNSGIHIAFDNPLPLLPSLRLSYDRILSNGAGTTQQSFVFGGNTYIANAQTQGRALLKQGSALFFWTPLDNPLVDVRLGFEIRWMEMNVAVSGQGTTTAPGGIGQPFQAHGSAGGVVWLPMVNAGFTWHLPAGLDISSDGSLVRFGSSYLYDARVGVGYSFGPGLTASLGYRRMRMHLDSARIGLSGAVQFSGMYAGLGWHF